MFEVTPATSKLVTEAIAKLPPVVKAIGDAAADAGSGLAFEKQFSVEDFARTKAGRANIQDAVRRLVMRHVQAGAKLMNPAGFVMRPSRH